MIGSNSNNYDWIPYLLVMLAMAMFTVYMIVK